MTSNSSARNAHRLPGLDALRGFAIALVVLRHACGSALGGAGIIGVVIFFTLSGYLITGILVREIDRTGGVSLRRFYRNRALRLGPALLAFLVSYAVVEAITNRLNDRSIIASTVAVALSYTADLRPPVSVSTGLSHLWTLAVEEQFYLLWPTLLVLAARRRLVRRSVTAAAGTFLILCAATLAAYHDHIVRVYTLPTTWAVTLVMGAAAFLGRDCFANVSARFGAWPAIAALTLLIAMCFVPDVKGQPLTYLIGGPLVAACTIALISHVAHWHVLPSKVLVPLRWLGFISYAAYLWNYLVVGWLRAGEERNLTPREGAASVFLTLVVATVSWFLVERPALAWKARLVDRSSNLGCAASRRLERVGN